MGCLTSKLCVIYFVLYTVGIYGCCESRARSRSHGPSAFIIWLIIISLLIVANEGLCSTARQH